MKGRGATYNPLNRYQTIHCVDDPDIDDPEAHEQATSLETLLLKEDAKSIISRNQSPDIYFSQSINPYRGCEHGCIYCYARPSHAWLDLSPGLDFETKIICKTNAAELLAKTLSKPGYQCQHIVIGANTDPYQPAERKLGITRSLLKVLLDYRHPVGLITKGGAIERDIDLLAKLAKRDLVSVMISVTSLSRKIKRTLEPRTASPTKRLQLIKQLTEAGVPTGMMVAPVIPKITDHEVENILQAGTEAGARFAGYVLLRLPYEVKPLFEAWLEEHYPLRAKAVMSLIRQNHKGKAYNSAWGIRHRGQGVFAQLLAHRFNKACHRLGLNKQRWTLSTRHFRVPNRAIQCELF